MLAEKRCIQTGSHRKQPPQADSQEKREQAQVQPLCPVRPVKKSKVSVPVSPWFCLLSALPLVVRFGRSAAQILQNGPRQLGLLGCAPCSPSGGPFWPLSSPNPSKRTSPPWSVVRFGRSEAQIRQNGLPLLFQPHRPLSLSAWCSVLSAA